MEPYQYLEPYTYPKFNAVRRIWRILYPMLLFIGIQLVVMFIAAFVQVLIITLNPETSGIATEAMLEQVMELYRGNIMLYLTISQVVSLAVFIPTT